MPDSVESRLQRLEAASARMEERLEHEREDIHELMEAVRRLPEELAILRERVGAAIKRSTDCVNRQEQLARDLQKREKEQSDERKSDRRWLVGTFIAASGLVVTALAILVDKI